MRLCSKFFAPTFLLLSVISISLPSFAEEIEYGCKEYEKELYQLEITGYSEGLSLIDEEYEKQCVAIKEKATSLFNDQFVVEDLFCSLMGHGAFGILRAVSEPTFGQNTQDTCYKEESVKDKKLSYTISQTWGCCIPQPQPKPKKDEKKDDCCRCPSFGEIDEMTKDHYEDFVFFRGLQGDPYNPDKGNVCRIELEWAELLGGLTDSGGYITHIEGSPDEQCLLQEYCLYRSDSGSMGGTTFVAIACRR